MNSHAEYNAADERQQAIDVEERRGQPNQAAVEIAGIRSRYCSLMAIPATWALRHLEDRLIIEVVARLPTISSPVRMCPSLAHEQQ
jgi:hypothetical protein